MVVDHLDWDLLCECVCEPLKAGFSAKGAYGFHKKLNTEDVEKDLYWLVRQRNRGRNDVHQVKVTNHRDWSMLSKGDSVWARWKECFGERMNE